MFTSFCVGLVLTLWMLLNIGAIGFCLFMSWHYSGELHKKADKPKHYATWKWGDILYIGAILVCLWAVTIASTYFYLDLAIPFIKGTLP